MMIKKTPPHFLRFFTKPVLRIDISTFQHCLAKVRLSPFLFCLISISSLQVSWASDLAKEKRWAEQISDSLLDGEAIQLHNGSHEFLAIETQADDASKLGVIVIHGIGIHPDWPAVIQPLRVELAESGWNTLSLQMPVLNNEAKGNDYEPLMKDVPSRINAGIRYLSKQGSKRIAIVAHSMGARMASYYLANKKKYREAQTETPIAVYISIGMGIDKMNNLAKVNIPVFDIYGENDLPNVIASALDRKKSSGFNKVYKQIEVAQANHFFDGQNEALLKVVTESLVGF